MSTLTKTDAPRFIIQPDFMAELIALARCAGAAILDIYHAPEKINLQTKSDNSPITAADLAAHDILARGLAALLPAPILSEEGQLPAFAERKNWPRYWLIDPLDGTQEFVARSGEFTVNIALVEGGVPLVGVVHLPVLDETYLGVDKSFTAAATHNIAEKYRQGKKIALLKTRNLQDRLAAKAALGVLASARHGSAETAVLLAEMAQQWPTGIDLLNAGSSLKFCWIAEGRADFYPRLAPTCEWDTAAAQAVLVAAGGAVVNANNLQPLTCNSADSLLNPSFYAWGDKGFNWAQLLRF
jgi:3'(2'), 5'-bisphosphate nucleotidase